MNIVVNFQKCSKGSITASNKIAKWLSELLDYKLIDDKTLANNTQYLNIDTMFIVNGMSMFCDYRDEIVYMAEKARKVIWVGNDYAIPIPNELKFIKEKEGFVRMAQYENFDNFPNHIYVDFNKLLHTDKEPVEYAIPGLFYYGAFRKDRLDSFKQYLRYHPKLNIHISTSHKNSSKFLDLNFNAHIWDGKGDIRDILPRYQCSIYIQDKTNETVMMTPANRFYEVIGSKTLLFYDMKAKSTLERAGYWDDDFGVTCQDEIVEKLNNYNELRNKQISMFGDKDYRQELNIEFLKEYEKIRF